MLYRSQSIESCYGEEDVVIDSVLDVSPPVGTAVGVEPKIASQADIDRIVQARVKKMQDSLQKTEASLKEALTSKNLTEKERQTLQDNLSEVQGSLRTKEQQMTIEKREMEAKHAAELSEIAEKGKTWETLFRDSTIDRSLVDAGINNDAYNPNQIMVQLRPWTRLVEVVDDATKKPTGTYKVVVDFPDVNATTGEPEKTARTPDEAVKRMRELNDTYGNLFRGNVVSGIGSSNLTGGTALGGDGKPSAKILELIAKDPVKYRQARIDHPEWFGLKPSQQGITLVRQ